MTGEEKKKKSYKRETKSLFSKVKEAGKPWGKVTLRSSSSPAPAKVSATGLDSG